MLDLHLSDPNFEAAKSQRKYKELYYHASVACRIVESAMGCELNVENVERRL